MKKTSKNAVVVVAKLCPTHCNAMDWTYQSSLSVTTSQSLPKLVSIELVMQNICMILLTWNYGRGKTIIWVKKEHKMIVLQE